VPAIRDFSASLDGWKRRFEADGEAGQWTIEIGSPHWTISATGSSVRRPEIGAFSIDTDPPFPTRESAQGPIASPHPSQKTMTGQSIRQILKS